ncbi:GIY-YIG nuclease family protein, partial [Salinimicrobium xinjiangense]|uniref:GIY-YIG nuclease family protein n=1 Tax=Salinimicrobium xinjiangense TaxID=438596 RepID=UPI00048BE551
MHFLYILYSSLADKYYTGETHDVPARIELHNSHKNLKAFTKAASDWESKLIFKCEDKKEAVFLERFIKKMKSRKFIE